MCVTKFAEKNYTYTPSRTHHPHTHFVCGMVVALCGLGFRDNGRKVNRRDGIIMLCVITVRLQGICNSRLGTADCA
jgi:hypothetical protein